MGTFIRAVFEETVKKEKVGLCNQVQSIDWTSIELAIILLS
jgi:hypothetical protein